MDIERADYGTVIEFGSMNDCFEKVTSVDDKNKRGYSIRDMIAESGTEALKKAMEDKWRV